MQSTGLLAAHQAKQDRYALLAAITERQVQDGLRTAPPLIMPVAVSTHGELCAGAVRLQEWLVEKYRARLQLEGDRDDGAEEAALTAAFRREFRASLIAAVARGHSDMLAAAGLPFHHTQDRHRPPLTQAGTDAARPRDSSAPSAGASGSGSAHSDTSGDDSASDQSDDSSGNDSDSDVDCARDSSDNEHPRTGSDAGPRATGPVTRSAARHAARQTSQPPRISGPPSSSSSSSSSSSGISSSSSSSCDIL